MIALCVDDEILLLNALVRAVRQSPEITEVHQFDDEFEAIEWARSNPYDIAFLDIQIHDMNGIELAVKLREITPDIPVIFCTGFSEYAVEAFHIHANGFLVKPVKPADVQREIEHIAKGKRRTLLTVRHGENLTVTDKKGNALGFRRSRTAKLFAALYERNGVAVTSDDLRVLFWGEAEANEQKNKDYLRQLFGDLNQALQDANASAVLQKTAAGYALNMSLIETIE